MSFGAEPPKLMMARFVYALYEVDERTHGWMLKLVMQYNVTLPLLGRPVWVGQSLEERSNRWRKGRPYEH